MSGTIEPGSTLRAYSDVEYVFEPHVQSLPNTREYLEDLWDRRQFMVALARADLKGPRAGTVLGELWGVIDPLFQAAIYWFLVSVIRGGSGGTKYLTMVVSSVFLFNFTRVALGEGGRSILRGRGLVLNSTFPRALLPLSAIYKGLLEFAPSVVVYAIIHLALQAPVGSGIFLLPLLFLLQVLISTGLALIFSTLTVYVRDMSNLLDYIMRILLFVTPVIYPVTQLTPTMRTVLQINPLYALFAMYQIIIQGGMPPAGLLVQSLAWAVVLPVVGFRVFVANERGFALRL